MKRFRDEVRRVHAETGVATLVLTNDPREALALADRVISKDEVAALGQVDVQSLVRGVRLAHRRMTARAEDPGQLAFDLLGAIEQRRHEVPGEALEDQLVDLVVVPVDAVDFLDRWDSGLLR